MEQEQSSALMIPAAILVAGALVAGAIYYGGSTGSLKTAKNDGNANTDVEVKPVTNEDHLFGKMNAKLTVVEYSDTECPFCKVFHSTMKEIVAKYGDGDVAWVYRHFPIPQLHQRAMNEAEATECVASIAGEATFWRYLDKIFETTNSNDSLDPAQLPKLASDLGVDETEFNTCLSNGRFEEKIKTAMEDAVRAGARGTPYSVILDSKGSVLSIVNGAESLATVAAKIDALLR
ncbi:MAG TPA: thioredoxin domain-containing protein [Candidatus Paceibacterota bacterium]